MGMTAAKIFSEARKKKGLTQAEVAKKAGMHANTYAKIERGINKPSPESIKALVKVLGIDSSKVLSLL